MGMNMKNHKAKPILIGILSLSVFLTAGCSTALPNKTFVRRGTSYRQTMPAVDRAGLLVDGLVAYDRTGSRYYDIEDSLTAISNLTREAESELKAKGYELAFVEAPFVGGFRNPSVSSPVASRRKEGPQQQTAPFRTADYLDTDPAYRDILLITSRRVLGAVEKHGALPTETLQSAQDVKPALTALADKKHIRYLFVVQGNGVVESGGKQVGQEIGSAVFTAVISLGTVSGSVHNVSFLDSYVSLVDLQNAEVVWCNSLRLAQFNPANSSHYPNRWAHNLLYWLPPRGKLEPQPR
jgi:hypothetical protein